MVVSNLKELELLAKLSKLVHKSLEISFQLISYQISGAPNENIVQNHLNI